QLFELLQLKRRRVTLGRREVDGKSLWLGASGNFKNAGLVSVGKGFHISILSDVSTIRLMNHNRRIQYLGGKLDWLADGHACQCLGRAAGPIEQCGDEG